MLCQLHSTRREIGKGRSRGREGIIKKGKGGNAEMARSREEGGGVGVGVGEARGREI